MQFDVYCNMLYQVFQKHIAWYNFFTILKKDREKEKKKKKKINDNNKNRLWNKERKKNETKLYRTRILHVGLFVNHMHIFSQF